MSLIDKLNGSYFLETSLSIEKIVNNLNYRIDESNKNASWFFVPDIDYRNIQVDSSRMIVKRRNRVTRGPLPGTGNILVHFKETINGETQVIAEVKPEKTLLWVVIGFLIFFSATQIWRTRDAETILIVTVAWAVLAGISYLLIILSRYLLKNYLQAIFADIGINQSLEKTNG